MGKASSTANRRNYKKRKQLLGMSLGTAYRMLLRKIIGRMVIGTACCKCGKPLDDSWTIEHTTPWINAPDPKEAYFDVEQIAFSHSKCNTRWTNEKRGSDKRLEIAQITPS